MTTLLYGLIESRPEHPCFGLPFYIGIGTVRRPRDHIRAVRRASGHTNSRVHAVIAAHLATGMEPGIVTYATYDTAAEAGEKEREMIALYGRIGMEDGGILCNIGAGGEMPDTELCKGAEMRQKISENTKAALSIPDVRERHVEALRRISAAIPTNMKIKWSQDVSLEIKEKRKATLAKNLSDPVIRERCAAGKAISMKADWADPERRAKRTAALKGNKKTMTPAAIEARRKNARKPRSKDAIEAQRAAAVRNWSSDEFRVERARSQAAAWEDPGKRANMLAGRSQGISKSWGDPAVRARRIAGIKAAALKRAETKRGHNDTVS